MLLMDRGTIQVSKHSGVIAASSNGGAIEVNLEFGTTAAGLTLSSVTGPITVSTPDTSDLEVAMSTSGSFITDYSLTVRYRNGEQPNKTATAIIGTGGAVVTMTSGTGDLALRRVGAGAPK